MVKENIRIRKAIVHIMDSTIGMPVLSDAELEYGSEFADFLREHIAKISSGDDAKECRFYQEESEVYHILEQYSDESFVDISKDIASLLYDIMNSNIDIPAADLIIVRFQYDTQEYLALLKMNYKSLYTHRTMTLEEGNSNEIIRHKSILPSEGQRLTERSVRIGDKLDAFRIFVLVHRNLDFDSRIRIQMLALVFSERILALRLYFFFYHIILFHLILKSDF